MTKKLPSGASLTTVSAGTSLGVASDDIFDFTRLPGTLALDNRARENNVFAIEDGEIVILKFLRRVNGQA
jgi:hypothetical protein